jgi:hypothetical protein
VDRNQCTFLAPLDTVLRTQPTRIEPVLRFLSLVQRHFVVSDTQVVDHVLFRDEPLDRYLSVVFERPSYDGLPLFVVSKRDERSLREIVLESMACVGNRKATAFPMHFSSLSAAGRSRLAALVKSGTLTTKAFFRDVGYPESYLNRISRIERRADTGRDLVWNSDLRKPAIYHGVVRAILGSNVLETQAALGQKGGVRSYFRELRQRVIEMDANSFSRTVLHRELTRQRRNRAKVRRLSRIPLEGFQAALGIVESVGTFAYLRNFADWNGFAFLVDRQLWLPSSVMNQELAQVRPQAEEADDMVEACLGVEEGFAGGSLPDSMRSLTALLDACGFTAGASWNQIAELRESKRFWDSLGQIELNSGDDQARALRNHVVWCLRELLKRPFDWEGFSINAVCGAVGAAALATGGIGAAAALGFATAGGGVALAMAALRGGRKAKQAMLFDQVANKAAAELLRKNRPESGVSS